MEFWTLLNKLQGTQKEREDFSCHFKPYYRHVAQKLTSGASHEVHVFFGEKMHLMPPFRPRPLSTFFCVTVEKIKSVFFLEVLDSHSSPPAQE